MLKFLEVWCIIGENNDSLIVDLRIHDEPLIGRTVIVTCDGHDTQTHSTRRRAIQRLVDILIIGEVVLAILELLGRIDFTEHGLRDAGNDLRTVYNRVFDVNSDVLLFVGQEGIGIAISGDIVLRQQSFQRLRNRCAKCDLVSSDVFNHQDSNVVDVCLNVLNVAHEIKQLEDIHILLLNTVMIVCCGLATVNHTANSTLKEGMNGIIEEMERNKSILVLLLHLLSSLLETGQHGSLTTGKVLTGIAMLADLSKDFLDDDKLIRDKREGSSKLFAIGKALDVQHRIVEGIEVLQNSVFLIIDHLQKLVSSFGLRQHTLLDDFINRRRGQTETSIEASLNLGEVIAGNMNNRVDCLLARNHDPNLATAASTDFLNNGLEVDHQITIVTDVLTYFVHHEEKPEVLSLAVNIFFDVSYELRDAEFICFLAVKPITGSLFAHAQNGLQTFNDVILEEGEGISRFDPRYAIDFLKCGAELLCLSLPFDEAFQLCDLQIIAIETAVIIEHLRKDTENSGLILCDRTFDVDVEKNRLSRH